MREIKFRAWDKRKKYMSQVNGFSLVVHVDTGKTTKDVQLAKPFMKKDKYGGHPCYWARRDDVVLVQYVGLKDKNHKRIYEGDILGTPPDNVFGIVGFGEHNVIEDYYAYEAYGWYLEHKGKKSGILTEDLEFVEIIGNIHENPELLENK